MKPHCGEELNPDDMCPQLERAYYAWGLLEEEVERLKPRRAGRYYQYLQAKGLVEDFDQWDQDAG